MKTNILLHVSGEIGTKGKNRIIFERKLYENIKKKINIKIERAFGSFLLEIDENEKEKAIEKLSKIPGIAWLAEVKKLRKNLKEIKKEITLYLQEKKIHEFDIEIRRQDKKIKKTSQQIRNELINLLLKKLSKKFLFKPKSKTKIFVELNKKWWVIFDKKIKGISGLPTSISGRIIAMLSGGIDSAVASFLGMKKGLEVIFVHFHNYPNNEYKAINEKIVEIVKKLNAYQIISKLYIIPFAEIQKEIIKKISQKYRYLFYKFLMLKIAEEIAKKENAEIIITGDSLGQVASQTLTNIKTLQQCVSIPIFMPLIAYTKEEIIEIAKKIGTYDLSIIPYSDCCSFMIAKHPATKIKKYFFEKLINEFNFHVDMNKIIAISIEKAKIVFVKDGSVECI